MTRVLHSGDPRGEDLRAAQEWVRDIRSRLSHIRGELEDLSKIEASFAHDSLSSDVAGAMTLALITLHTLVEGERSFEARAQRVDALWADVAANPDSYRVEDGKSWDWQPRGIFRRGGRASEEVVQLRMALAALVEMRDTHYEIYGYEKQHYIIDENAQWTRARKLITEGSRLT